MMSAATAATLLSSDVLTKTISFTTSNIFTLGKTLLYTEQYVDLSSVEKIEKKLDLLETIKIYDVWIQEVVERKSVRIKESPALQQAIQSFTAALHDVHELLQRIDQKVKDHKMRWFYSYRSLSFHDEIEQLQVAKTILDHRFTLLQQINQF